MRTLEVQDAARQISELAHEAAREPVILVERGQPLAAVVPMASVDVESLALASDPEFLKLLDESRRSLRTEGGIPLAEMRRRMGLAQPSRTGRARSVARRLRQKG